ncbi:MAG: hypothetical protein JRM97_09500 [Nitrososphaerota archaeon]|nr:hypothetical protein [Nitrososphaerota archaeon]
MDDHVFREDRWLDGPADPEQEEGKENGKEEGKDKDKDGKDVHTQTDTGLGDIPGDIPVLQHDSLSLHQDQKKKSKSDIPGISPDLVSLMLNADKLLSGKRHLKQVSVKLSSELYGFVLRKAAEQHLTPAQWARVLFLKLLLNEAINGVDANRMPSFAVGSVLNFRISADRVELSPPGSGSREELDRIKKDAERATANLELSQLIQRISRGPVKIKWGAYGQPREVPMTATEAAAWQKETLSASMSLIEYASRRQISLDPSLLQSLNDWIRKVNDKKV